MQKKEIELNVPVRSVGKALRLLEMITLEDPSHEGISLTELAREIDMKLNSTRNILKTMLICGMLSQNEQRLYVPGPKILAIGRLNLFRGARLEKIEQQLLRFSQKTQEASVFAVLHRGRRLVIARSQSSHVVKVDAKRETANIFAHPTGRVLVAYAAPEEQALIIETNGWPGKAWNSIDNQESLTAAMQAIKKEKCCLINPDNNATTSMAVPVFDAEGNLLGALGSYAPHFRCSTATIKNMQAELFKTAEKMTKEI